MAVTIKDVAKKANVSPSTVSRVIANNSRITEETKQRVRDVMEELGYYPNFQARNLVSNKTNTIGVVMANSATLSFQNPFFPEVLRGISSVAHDNQYGLYLTTGANEEEVYNEVVSMVQGRRVDGIILLYSRQNDATMNYLANSSIPFTIVGRPFENPDQFTYVDNNNVDNAKEAVHYLIELGHERIAFVGGGLDYIVSQDRLKGYQQALADAGIPFNEQYFINEEETASLSRDATLNLMNMDQPPTAIVTHDDLVAYEVIRYLEELAISVPYDLSIVSFNNHKISEHLRPPLTSVDISIYDLGYEANRLLINKINDPDTEEQHVIVPSTLIKRGSCRQLP
ncbi:DNA-binding LacI/PurR family transcriptional regulator [Alkalibacillus flavidus]|uniref:DNA-binding LacI/PurR family transcriptional regulator n=1 Tax=Alkalibacillus flavidus TaxID=546021 RepID=A0ABV2KTF2_9BACI